MPNHAPRFKKIKADMVRRFSAQDLRTALEHLKAEPPRPLVNPLFSLLLHLEPRVKWGAVKGFGVVVPRLAHEEMEAARTVMRRFMWQLNDESGGIGWGCAESLAEVIAVHEGLALEFYRVLISYIREEGNYLEYAALRRGALWGIGRVAEIRPELMLDAAPGLLKCLGAEDAEECALAARAAGRLRCGDAAPLLEALLDDGRVVDIFGEMDLRSWTVREVAAEAVERLRRLI